MKVKYLICIFNYFIRLKIIMKIKFEIFDDIFKHYIGSL